MKRLCERISSKIERQRKELVERLKKSDTSQQSEAIEEKLRELNNRAQLSMLLLLHESPGGEASSSFSHRMMYEGHDAVLREEGYEDDQEQSIDQIDAIQTIFELVVEDDQEDIIATYIIG